MRFREGAENYGRGEGSQERREVVEAVDGILQDYKPERIDPNGFRGLPGYSDAEIQADIEFVNRFSSQISDDTGHARDDKRRSKALEIIFARLIEDYFCLGDNFYFVYSSLYDDYKNGVDGILEYFDEKSIREHLALGIDATRAVTAEVIAEKISKGADRFFSNDRAKASTVKYFESPKNGDKSRLDDVLPVTVGMSGENTNSLILAFDRVNRLRKQLKREPNNKTIKDNLARYEEGLTNHPAPVLFIKEILLQLEMYREGLAAIADEKRRRLLATKISTLEFIFTEALRKKAGISLSNFEYDETFLGIKAAVTARRNRKKPN